MKSTEHLLGQGTYETHARAVTEWHDTNSFRRGLLDAASDILEQSRMRFAKAVQIVAGSGNDGYISKEEWQDICSNHQQLIDWINHLGNYWLDLVSGVTRACMFAKIH